MVLYLGIYFHAVNHDERIKSFRLSSIIYYLYCYDSMLYNASELHNSSMFTIIQYCTMFTVAQLYIVHKSNNKQFTVTQSSLNQLMEPPSRTTPFLDILFTPPVYKTYIFHQDFSSRDNLMHSIKVTP